MVEEDAKERTARIITQLRSQEREAEAQELHLALTTKVGDAFFLALREACDTVLTMIEAFDPETETLLEELRADIDAKLTPHHTPPTPR